MRQNAVRAVRVELLQNLQHLPPVNGAAWLIMSESERKELKRGAK